MAGRGPSSFWYSFQTNTCRRPFMDTLPASIQSKMHGICLSRAINRYSCTSVSHFDNFCQICIKNQDNPLKNFMLKWYSYGFCSKILNSIGQPVLMMLCSTSTWLIDNFSPFVGLHGPWDKALVYRTTDSGFDPQWGFLPGLVL